MPQCALMLQFVGERDWQQASLGEFCLSFTGPAFILRMFLNSLLLLLWFFFFSSSSPFNSAEPSASLAAHLTAVWSFPKSRLPASCRLTHTKVQISLGRFSPESKLKTNQKRKIEVEDSVFSTFSKRTDIFPRPPGAVQSAEIFQAASRHLSTAKKG